MPRSFEMVEASERYLWQLSDRVGSGATSDVYKAYDISSGEMVAAKVSKVRSAPRVSQARSSDGRLTNSQSIFDHEIHVLQNLDHKNIVRYIGVEFVTKTNDTFSPPNREVLFLEFCNGGSLGDILRSPANRYGLPEEIVRQIMGDVTSALKYLHQKSILHRDIKPDNIMQLIDINGKATFKLTDLGFAREVLPEESASYSIRGTEEYVHPIVYTEVFPEIKMSEGGKTPRTRMLFPFEVEMWSFGVTIYQCSTGRIPFLPYEGARNDRNTMRKILTKIPPGHISGIQLSQDGDITYSKVLPDWCRLSPHLKSMLEKLLAKLFETNHDRLMKHEDFFSEIEQIVNLTPIYHLNFKRLTLSCTYLPKEHYIDQLFDQIQDENNDEIDEDYHCLYQNVHYPISKTERMTIEKFYEQLPSEPSREEPLVIYTFSSLKFDQNLIPRMDIPDLQPMKNLQDVFSSVLDWSKNITGSFFYMKQQLDEYESMMKIIQGSITIIHRFLKSNLLKLLCDIRKDIFHYQTIYELDRINIIIKSKSSNIQDLSTLQSGMNSYNKLKESERTLNNILEEYFTDRPSMFTPGYICKQIIQYSSHIHPIDKYTKDAMDSCERFKRDTQINRASSSQMTSNLLRKKRLETIHDHFIRLINVNCYPSILEIFNQYKKMIKQQADINQQLRIIRTEYEEQAESQIAVDRLRRMINQQLKNLAQNIDQQPVIPEEMYRSSNTRISLDMCSTTMHDSIKQIKDNDERLDRMIENLKRQRNNLMMK